jgi:hypothetical protein
VALIVETTNEGSLRAKAMGELAMAVVFSSPAVRTIWYKIPRRDRQA